MLSLSRCDGSCGGPAVHLVGNAFALFCMHGHGAGGSSARSLARPKVPPLHDRIVAPEAVGTSRDVTRCAQRNRNKYKDAKDDLYWTTQIQALEMLAKAMDAARSTDPVKVARALEGMKYDGDTGEVFMRADNHQLIQPLFVSTYSKVNGKEVEFDIERTGNGFKTDRRIEGKDTIMPTSCKMERP
jgi:hypothetical protein